MPTVPRAHGRVRKYLDKRQEVISRHRTLRAAVVRAEREQHVRERQLRPNQQHVQIARDTSPSAYKYAVQTKHRR